MLCQHSSFIAYPSILSDWYILLKIQLGFFSHTTWVGRLFCVYSVFSHLPKINFLSFLSWSFSNTHSKVYIALFFFFFFDNYCFFSVTEVSHALIDSARTDSIYLLLSLCQEFLVCLQLPTIFPLMLLRWMWSTGVHTAVPGSYWKKFW